MKTRKMLSWTLAVALILTCSSLAFAADAAKPAACAASCDAQKAAPDAKAKADKPKTEVKCEAVGTLSSKTGKNKKGKEVQVYSLKVSSAKGADGKAMDTLTGKTVHVGAKKGTDLSGFVGKEVTIAGKLINDKRLVVETIK